MEIFHYEQPYSIQIGCVSNYHLLHTVLLHQCLLCQKEFDGDLVRVM